MYRFFVLLGCLLLVGCGLATDRPIAKSTTPKEHVRAVTADDNKDKIAHKEEKPEPRLPPDLRTRKTGSDWPHFLGPTGDSVSAEKGIFTKWPKTGPKLLWHQETGIGYAMPSISRGRLFIFDRVRNRCRLRALNAETGKELWKFDYATNYKDAFGYNGGPRCCPVVDDDRVYIYGPEGMLHCIGAKDGKKVWAVDTLTDFGVMQNFFGVGSTPVIEGNLLIAQVGGSPAGSENIQFDQLKGNGSGVVAFDKFTGKVKWKATDELASYSSPVVRTIGKRRWCFVFWRAGLLGMDPATGKVDFHYPWRTDNWESVNASNPVVVGDRVLISECYDVGSSLLEVKPGGYKKIWTDANKGRKKSMLAHWMTPIHVNGYVYGSSGRHTKEAELRCIELATGKIMWSEKGLTRCSLLQVDGHFVCLGENGHLRLLKINSQKYEEVASAVLRGTIKDDDDVQLLEYPCWAAPILANGLMYLKSEDRLVCVELIPTVKKD